MTKHKDEKTPQETQGSYRWRDLILRGDIKPDTHRNIY
jgi:hypothetical protein